MIAHPGDVEETCEKCRSKPDSCDCMPVLDPAAALERLRKAAESADDEDLVPVAVDAELRAMAREGIDMPVRLAIRSYLAREKKHLGIGLRDLERIEKTAANEAFAEAMRERALAARTHSSASLPPADDAHLHTPPAWASDQDILRRMVRTLRVCMGLVGENRNAKLTYLGITSRLLGKQVSIVVKGLSSSGKSYTVECVLALFPAEAVYTMTAMSERALIYLDEDLAHRTVVLFEATALREGREKAEENQTAYIVRSLLSEGRIEYPTVVRDEDGTLRTVKLVKEGPTNLLTTTTSLSLHGENETRMFSLPSNDTKAQTRAVLLSSASDDGGQEPDLSDWHAYQRWLATANHQVTIPFAACIAWQIPPVAVRLRRDWNGVRALIRAHAMMHQLNRQTDDQGRIIATLDDYRAIRSLVADLVAEGVGTTVPDSVRETVELVQALTVKADAGDEPPCPDGATVAKIASLLKLERSAATRRLHSARDRGYLVNQEDKKGRPARYVTGDPLPADVVLLPEPAQVCTGDCTHLGEGEIPDQDCDCTGVCRCADDAEPIEAGNIYIAEGAR
jgi:hypothetical protein